MHFKILSAEWRPYCCVPTADCVNVSLYANLIQSQPAAAAQAVHVNNGLVEIQWGWQATNHTCTAVWHNNNNAPDQYIYLKVSAFFNNRTIWIIDYLQYFLI